ncbi:MAG TPA: Asp-tRNA(Asn)/Glu-tRNA(Gln) amidotransferase subunit GatC [Casimicrobiaceae bacterium]|nr:Asp-tRNA(Asn)/Glu-tRNA(Gln) amidotransferase subunit GatC [Casimicrobiaceae bacterium]
MTVSPADIRRLAYLARLELDDVQVQAVRAKLEGIFGMIDELQAVDTTGVVPMAHAQDVAAPLRQDEASERDEHARFQAVAPAVERGLYLVPKVIE